MGRKIELEDMEIFYLAESLKAAIKNHDFLYHETKIKNHPDKAILESQKVELRELLNKLEQ